MLTAPVQGKGKVTLESANTLSSNQQPTNASRSTSVNPKSFIKGDIHENQRGRN